MAYLGNSIAVRPVTGADIVDGTVMAADMKAGEITAAMVGAYTKAETDAKVSVGIDPLAAAIIFGG